MIYAIDIALRELDIQELFAPAAGHAHRSGFANRHIPLAAVAALCARNADDHGRDPVAITIAAKAIVRRRYMLIHVSREA
jgi:hypothetical protein